MRICLSGIFSLDCIFCSGRTNMKRCRGQITLQRIMVDLCFPLFLELGVLDFVTQAQTTGFSSSPSWPHQCPKSQKAENLNQPLNTSS